MSDENETPETPGDMASFRAELAQMAEMTKALMQTVKNQTQMVSDARAEADTLRAEAKAAAEATEAKRLEAEKAAAAKEPEAKKVPKGSKPPVAEAKPDPRIAELENRLKEMQDQALKAQEARAAAEAKAKRESFSAATRAELAKHYPAAQVDNVMARLAYDEALAFDGDAPAMYVDKADVFGVVSKQTVPVSEAVAEFIQSDVGKSFLPPKPVQGTGQRPPTTSRPPPAGGEKASLADVQGSLAAKMRKHLAKP